MILSSVLLISGAHAASRVRTNNHLDHATVEEYGAEHLGSIDMAKFLMSWNETMGPPPRGWYKAEFFMDKKLSNNEIIKKSGDDSQTISSFDFAKYPNEHYCRFRNDDTGENDECCNSEDQNCYTKAGCYCDTACFTIYGDCCTDHFVTCYDDLKLCLKKVKKDEPSGEEAPIDLPGNHGNKKLAPRSNLLNEANVGGTNPAHVEPNACCGQEEYNDAEKCCLTNGKIRKTGSGPECESVESSDSDERAQSPEPDTPIYDDETDTEREE